MKNDISGFYLTDEEDKETMRSIYEKHKYIVDPHGAIGYAAIKEYQKDNPDTVGIYLETAHPAKFSDVVDDVLSIHTPIPEKLSSMKDLPKKADKLPNEYQAVKSWLLSRRT